MAKYFPGGEIKTIQRPIIYEEPNGDYIFRLEKKIKGYIAERVEEHRMAQGKTMSWELKHSANIKNQLLVIFEQFKYKIRPESIDGDKAKEHMKEAANSLLKIKMVEMAHSRKLSIRFRWVDLCTAFL
jgi:hypothetical protein